MHKCFFPKNSFLGYWQHFSTQETDIKLRLDKVCKTLFKSSFSKKISPFIRAILYSPFCDKHLGKFQNMLRKSAAHILHKSYNLHTFNGMKY